MKQLLEKQDEELTDFNKPEVFGASITRFCM